MLQHVRLNQPSVSRSTPATSTLANSVSDYAIDNEALINSDSTLQMIIQFMQAKLFCDGCVFINGREILVPSSKLETEVQHYWTPFLHKSMRFVMAHGYLVFTIYTNSKGITIPDVPDFNLLTMHMRYADNTCEPVIDVQWKNDDNTSSLYVINNQTPYGITPANTLSPVDRVKSLLRQSYELVENRTVAGFVNSRPPIGVQFPVSHSAVSADQIGNIDDMLEMRNIEAIEAQGRDDLFISRIQRMATPGKASFVNNIRYNARPWWIKAEERKNERPETKFMYIPHGLVHANTQVPVFDPEYVPITTMLLENICNVFGIPYSAIFKSSGRQTTNEVEMHKTMLINTLKMWWFMYKTILTDVYRLIYDYADDAKTKKQTTVHLKSEFLTSPEQVKMLYDEGVIAFDTFQRLRLQSVGLPEILADTSIPPPLRESLTMEEMIEIKEKTAPVSGSDTTVSKKHKSSSSAKDKPPKKTKTADDSK